MGVIGGIIIEKKFGIADKVIEKYNDVKSQVSAKIEEAKSEAESAGDFEETK